MPTWHKEFGFYSECNCGKLLAVLVKIPKKKEKKNFKWSGPGFYTYLFFGSTLPENNN